MRRGAVGILRRLFGTVKKADRQMAKKSSFGISDITKALRSEKSVLTKLRKTISPDKKKEWNTLRNEYIKLRNTAKAKGKLTPALTKKLNANTAKRMTLIPERSKLAGKMWESRGRTRGLESDLLKAKGTKTAKISDKLKKIVNDPLFSLAALTLPEAAALTYYITSERRKGREETWRLERERRKGSEMAQQERILQQRREREERKRLENQLRREAMTRKASKSEYRYIPSLRRKVRVGRPKKKGRKRVYYPVKRGGKTYQIRRGIRSQKAA